MTTVYLFVRRDDKARRGDFLRQALRQYALCSGNPLPHLNIARPESGRPRLAPPFGVEFSVSHSEALWVCAVAPVTVGVDVQFEKPISYQKIAKRFFHPQEYALLEKCGFSDFYRVWSAKESYVKLLGKGIDGDFGKFSVYDLKDAVLQYPIQIDGYALCLCCREPFETVITDLR